MKKSIIYDYAMSLLGLPYIWGGDDPIKGFDCSGLVLELLRAAGVFPNNGDMTAQGLCDKYLAEHAVADFGDLAFYGKDFKSITHVGFCLSSTSMIEAGGGGSATINAEKAASQNAYVRIRPITFRTDLVSIKRPNYVWS